MSKPHPLEQAVRVWAADPQTWVFRHKHSVHIQDAPPTAEGAERFECVPRAWLDDPDSVEVLVRYFRENNQIFKKCLTPLWDHEHNEYLVRPKPKQVTLPERRIPEPMREAPRKGADYWLVYPTYPEWAVKQRWSWGYSAIEHEWLRRGLIYASRCDAIAAAKAMTLGGQDE